MDETGTYGQFGRATYDRDEKEWHFQRTTSPSIHLQALGDSKVTVDGFNKIHDGRFAEAGKEGPSRRRENQVKAIVKRHPELQPASDFLPDLARISEAIEESSARHDPVKGNLLAFATIQDESRKHQAEVAVFPTGPTGSNLRVAQVRRQRSGWGNVRSTFLQVPTFHGEEALWEGPGVPIQSVAFANPVEGAENYLAVRMIAQILVFRPIIRKRSLPGGSRLDLNLMVTIAVDQTGSQPYADIVFNPWYSRQFTVLDQAGHCTVFQLQIGKTVGFKKLVARDPTGGILSKSKPPLQDSWGRVSWILGPSMLLVCNRWSCKILNITEQALEELHDLDLGLRDVGWILDMSILPFHPGLLAIISSHHVVIYQVSKLVAYEALRVRHFRSADDISLQTSCYSDGDDVLLFIRSSFDSMVVMFRLQIMDDTEVGISDPVELDLRTAQGESLTGICALHLIPVQMKGDPAAILEASESRNSSFDLRFAQLTTLRKDLSVDHALYVVTGNPMMASKLSQPTWYVRLKRTFGLELDDDFLVDDEATEEAAPSKMQPEPTSNFARRVGLPRISDPMGWTVNYELSVRNLNNLDVMEFTGVTETIGMIESILQEEANNSALHYQTLSELVNDEVTVQDLDSACAGVETLVSQHAARQADDMGSDDVETEQHTTSRILQPIKSLSCLDLPNMTSADRLRMIYADLSEVAIPQDSSGISDILRHAKRQAALRMAAGTTLASTISRPLAAEREEVPKAEFRAQDKSSVWELPVRTGVPLSARSQTPSVYFDSQSQIHSPRSPRLPTPSDTGSAASAATSNPTLARLGHYTTIVPNSKSAPLSRRLNRVLSHWTVGEDPAEYDWTTVSRKLFRREAEETQEEDMTEKERLRQQRRTERFVRRKQREAEEATRMQLLNSQAPVVLTSTQPTLGGSQQVGSGGVSQSQNQSHGRMAASQVLPGKHGGRPPAKKKRKQGF